MATLGTFVAGQVLTAAELNDIGTYTAYTPTWTNLTVGNGTVTFRYTQVNKLVHVIGSLTFGSTTSITAGTGVDFTLPVTAQSNVTASVYGVTRLFDTGTALYMGVTMPNGTTTARIYVSNVVGSRIGNANITATVPHTWATGDDIKLSLIYEAA